DYTHTPSSFDAVLKPLRDRAGKHRLVCVFGSAGERDTQKRPEQGAIAARYCDVLILTDEDPRGEQPMAILEDIAQGVQGKTRGTDLFLIPDRRAAIAQGLSMAGDGDIVVLLGKGHENSIIYNGTSIAWNEIEEAQAALNALGYRKERA
ncbi:MAG TPA: cyanophycin synthetase, partial [Spirochaetales bacterium]|nr:cyanophycin synthetase [Spirochaetales bacterium]